MDNDECPQVTVIPAERGWQLVIWQAAGDGEPDPRGGLRYLPVLAWLWSTTATTTATSI